MITFGNVEFQIRETKTNRQLVNVDITYNSNLYKWVIYAPPVNGDALLSYFSLISNIVEADIERKENIWANSPKTERTIDSFSGEEITLDIPKETIVHPTIPDYIEALAETGYNDMGKLNSILSELGENYWQYPQYTKRIIAPVDLIMDDYGIKMYGWFTINNFPVLKFNESVHLYCNVILPEHQAIVDGFGGLLTIEDKP
jgi:hypothetical protein